MRTTKIELERPFAMSMPHACVCETCRREMSPMFIAPPARNLFGEEEMDAFEKRLGLTYDPFSSRPRYLYILDAIDILTQLAKYNREMRGMIRACAAHCTDERFQKEAQKFTDQWA